jgi:hypothetical protein
MLGRFLKLFERKSDAYDALLGIGMQTAANIAVTPELALKCTPVYRDVSIRGDALVQAEIAARFEAYAKAITNGILNPNEARALENRPPYEGGNEFRVPMNTEAPGAAPAKPEPKPPVQQAKPRVVA